MFGEVGLVGHDDIKIGVLEGVRHGGALLPCVVESSSNFSPFLRGGDLASLEFEVVRVRYLNY